MKKFIFGFILGGIIVIATFKFIEYRNSNNSSLKLFEKPEMERCLSDIKELKVFQVLEDRIALTQENVNIDGFNLSIPYLSDIVLLIGKEGQQFYDNERITLKKNQCFKQKGTYQYKSKDGDYHTVPAVVVE